MAKKAPTPITAAAERLDAAAEVTIATSDDARAAVNAATAEETFDTAIDVLSDASNAAVNADEPEPIPEPVVQESTKPVTRVSQILSITTEKQLVSELKKFEDSIYDQVRPLRLLLAMDVHSVETPSIQRHMTEVERWREKVLRWASLAKTFVSHCKSDHFIIKREQGMKITEFDREAYQKKLLAGFVGLEYWLDGLVSTIDSRVNMAKVLLRLDEAGQFHPGAQQRVA